jgi:hypothetical protein
MGEFAQALGNLGSPTRWDVPVRTALVAELDAAYFHLYGFERDDVDYAIDSFSVLRGLGDSVTKNKVLRAFEAMAATSHSEVPVV